MCAEDQPPSDSSTLVTIDSLEEVDADDEDDAAADDDEFDDGIDTGVTATGGGVTGGVFFFFGAGFVETTLLCVDGFITTS